MNKSTFNIQLISVIWLFLFLLPIGLFAQESSGTENFTYIQIDSAKQMWGDWDEPEWLRYFGLDAGDVDRDGNIDIVSGRYIYHNPGGLMESHWKRTFLEDNVDGIFFMDVDDDPFADIIAMALPNLYWYEATNTSGTKYKRKRIGQVPATSHVNSQGFEKAQIIKGGKEELLIAGNGNIYVVQIFGENEEQINWKVKLICQNTSDEGIGVGDIDGDGDLDIAAGRRSNGEKEPKILVWYENPGSIDVLWKSTKVGESIHPIDRIEVADVDGDDQPDIIVTEERYPGLEPDANFWWFGQESLSTWNRNHIVKQYSINNLDIADFDKDGDVDLLTAEHKGKALELQLWYNDGKGNFSKTIFDTGKENHLGTQFVDLDHDGDLDIIGAGWDQHNFMHVWRNDAVKSLKSGMIFKDYNWTPKMVSDSGKFLRVGGKLDYALNESHFPKDGHTDGFISLDQDIDLTKATGAEVFVERVQSHEDTKDLKIQFNHGNAIDLHEPPAIPDTATNYMFHSNIKVPVPLSNLIQGNNNIFKFTVAKEQAWGWPQNIIYGVVLRIYYKSNQKENRIKQYSGTINSQFLEDEVRFTFNSDQIEAIKKVDYIGFFEDVNPQGDGKYRQWQYRYHRGEIQNHIGSSTQFPFEVVWKTDWLPDQSQPIKFMALITDIDGFIHTVSDTNDLQLLNRNYSVQLVKPYDQPPYWTTRSGEFTESMALDFQPSKWDTAKLYWGSWSPCYFEGLQINGIDQKSSGSTPCYDALWHEGLLIDITSLAKGENKLTTLKTPLDNGKMVHGMDVQYPGIMLKVKQKFSPKNTIEISEGIYENRPHFIIYTKVATYYFDIAGGGFSRIIDRLGNDWISYKTEPWNQYPASAASAFRGLPNLVYKSDTDQGAGHPGHDKCVSKIVGSNKIQTTSKSGHWQWECTFYDDHVVLEVQKTEDGKPYWFLYEGTPGGNYQPENYSYGTNAGGPNADTPDFYKGTINWGDYQWAYFNKKDIENTFFVAQIAQDDHKDMFSYLGNADAGVKSKEGMTVFGFGRGENNTPLLEGKNTFVIGMWDHEISNRKNHQQFSKYIDGIIKNTQ